MRRACLNIKFFLVVGIGGGVLCYGLAGDINTIGLGDIVVSSLQGNYSGVFTYDTSTWVEDSQLSSTGHLNGPPPELDTAVGSLW